ncbi:DUF3375 domain-containing protein [Cysteiniphilum sp. JM-1]|uniref:DUF3375 domain-containing protein n=1 Tax=Cysteiniphilum sp. JM-1 TaxID=2610891 RepID=UPI001243D05A|nr:DUF3375 domain-containing protein [Cysteiniphilum sp. JM-1]
MQLDYQTLESLRQNHPAWRLLASPHAPLIVSFLNRIFIAENVRVIAEADLIESLEDQLYDLRERLGDDSFPKSARDYLNDWAAMEKGWLRKFYRQDSDEAYFDLMPATEKAIAWLSSLGQRSFVGTESRLLMLFDLLKQITQGSAVDPETRLNELKKQREAIDAEIAQVVQGNITLLDDTALKDRFMQFSQQARELLSDFRQVEHNFRSLDRSVRERIALWDGKKGDLLADIMGERDAIADSDQGTSFQAFWDFLMSPARQEAFSQMLHETLNLPAISDLQPDRRTHRIHYDWLEAGEHTQRTVAQLSSQLRRFLDDQAWLENKRIMDIIRSIESATLTEKDTLFKSDINNTFMSINVASANIDLPMERTLYRPPLKVKLNNIKLEEGLEEADSSALFLQTIIDKQAIAQHIRKHLQQKTQMSLYELCQLRPLTQGLAELVAYLEMDSDAYTDRFNVIVDDTKEDVISWQANVHDELITRTATLPRVLYLRK